jgi:glycosyltransferase involved in cell wall biosynthesis
MRILQISSARTYGGGERHVRDLAHGLMDRGHEVFVALRPTNMWEDRLAFLPKENILHTSIRNSFGILSSKRIADFVKERSIDIVHAHVARDYIPASIACILAKDAKFVLTRHVLFELKPFNRFALKNLAKAIAVSSAVEANLRKIFPATKIALIPNGIGIEERSPQEIKTLRREFRILHDIPADSMVIGTVGELIELKGQREFVLAANEIAKEISNAWFVVVGKDHSHDQKFRRELKRLVKVFGLEERFLWLDWIEDTAPLLAAMDLFVSASHTESFGLAILEAMASGIPVIATDTAGGREVIGNEDLLVPVKDPVGLAAAVCAMLRDQARRESIGSHLAARAVENFSAERMVDETARLYRGLLNSQDKK